LTDNLISSVKKQTDIKTELCETEQHLSEMKLLLSEPN